MSAISESVPFALTFHNQVNGANGMVIPSAQSEDTDNARDAGSTFHTTVVTDPVDGRYMRLSLDYGQGIDDIPSVLSLGETTKKKTEGHTGLKNAGHIAALGTFKPDRVTYFSKTAASARPGGSTFSFDIEPMLKAIAREMEEGSRDYRKINHLSYMHRNTSRTEDDIELLKRCVAAVRNAEIKEKLQAILDKTAPSHFLQIMEFSNGATAAGYLDTELRATMKEFRFFYSTALLQGFQINYETLSGELIRLTADQAISPLGPAEFKRLLFSCQLRKAGTKEMICVSMKQEEDEDTEAKTFWIQSGGTVIRKPTDFDTAQILGGFQIRISNMSYEAYRRQAAILGHDVETLRGVYCEFNGRILGLPYWDGHNYGANRNAGGIHAMISFSDHVIAEKYLAIQGQKHNTNLKNAHPLFRTLLRDIMRMAIRNFSGYNLGTVANPNNRGTLSWPVERCWRLICGIPEPAPPAPPPPPPAPPSEPETDDEEDTESEEDEETDGESAASSVSARRPPPPAPPAPQPPAPAPALVISQHGDRLCVRYNGTTLSCPHYSKFSLFREILQTKFALLGGGERGFAYIREEIDLHLRYSA